MAWRMRWLTALVAAFPCAALAHVQDSTTGWTPDWGGAAVVVLLLLGVVLYWAGSWQLRRTGGGQAQPGRDVCFAGGAIVLAICLLPPLDAWSADSFAAHMVQHELLMLVAAPLLVLALPLPVFLWAFPEVMRRPLARWTRATPVRSAWRFVTHPATGWISHALALWIWHVPRFFRAALESSALHDLQHFSFVVTALLFWTGLLLRGQGEARGLSVLYLFTTTIHTGVLGALITFAGAPLYSPTIITGTAGQVLRDQQLGGLIMWVPGSMVYVAAGLALFLQWVKSRSGADATLQAQPSHQTNLR